MRRDEGPRSTPAPDPAAPEPSLRQLQGAARAAADSMFADARRLRRLAHAADWTEAAETAAPAGSPAAGETTELAVRVEAVHAGMVRLHAALDELAAALSARFGDTVLDADESASFPGEVRDDTIWVQEQERHRLAREIHDGPAQVLSNAVMEVEFCQRLLDRDPERARAELQKLKGNLRGGMAEIRAVLFDLRPPAMNDLGVAATLQRLAEEYQSRFGISVELEIADLAERLPKAQEVTVFRIVQEALQNVHRHAGTDHVVVRCQRVKGGLRLEIVDEGRGFDVDQLPEQRLGLVSMRERAQLAGGQLTIVSKPGAGTRVTVTLPVGARNERTNGVHGGVGARSGS